MTRQPISTKQFEAVKRCFEAYGADKARWPEHDRMLYDALSDADEFAQLRAEAEALDGFLGAATAPRMDASFTARLMVDYDAVQTGGRFTLWDRLVSFFSYLGEPRFVSAGVVAAGAALGIFTGLLSDEGIGTATPEMEAYAYLMDVAPSLYSDTEEMQWDVD